MRVVMRRKLVGNEGDAGNEGRNEDRNVKNQVGNIRIQVRMSGMQKNKEGMQ